MRCTEWDAMLRITLYQDAGKCRLALSGRLCGPWVRETESVWREARCSSKELEVDMKELTGVDDAGRALLAAMHQAGARFVVQGAAMAALVKQIAGKQTVLQGYQAAEKNARSEKNFRDRDKDRK
jgi:ABC-type transporter Mla MlaB component